MSDKLPPINTMHAEGSPSYAAEEARREKDRLLRLIGKPPLGSHPDEWEPRAESWHAERANWKKECDDLRAQLAAARQEAKDNDASYCVMRDALESTRKQLAQAEKERDEARQDLAANRLNASVVLAGADRMEVHNALLLVQAENTRKQLDTLTVQNAALREALDGLLDFAIFMTGSDDFSPNGKAYSGFEKLRPALGRALDVSKLDSSPGVEFLRCARAMADELIEFLKKPNAGLERESTRALVAARKMERGQ